jgi:hypothetical protein
MIDLNIPKSRSLFNKKHLHHILKITKVKRTRDMAPVVECLSSKYKALHLNPSTAKIKRRRKRKRK